MSEYLGSQKVNRSAYAVKEAAPTTIYLGVCERDNRPVRLEMPVDLGPTAEIPCFVGCTLPVKCERLHAVTTRLECDGSCMGARGPICNCGCGGINHGRHWGKGALLDQREVVESALANYRAEQAKIAQRREATREAAARRERSVFDDWAADHHDVIRALDPWHEHRTDDAWLEAHPVRGSHILVDLAIQAHGGWNGKPKPLTDPQVELVFKILGEAADRQRAEAERKANARPAPEGKGIKVSGEIIKVRASEGYAGEVHHEATVKCDGYAIRVTVPKAVLDWGWRERRGVIMAPNAHVSFRSYDTDWDGFASGGPRPSGEPRSPSRPARSSGGPRTRPSALPSDPPK